VGRGPSGPFCPGVRSLISFPKNNVGFLQP